MLCDASLGSAACPAQSCGVRGWLLVLVSNRAVAPAESAFVALFSVAVDMATEEPAAMAIPTAMASPAQAFRGSKATKMINNRRFMAE